MSPTARTSQEVAERMLAEAGMTPVDEPSTALPRPVVEESTLDPRFYGDGAAPDALADIYLDPFDDLEISPICDGDPPAFSPSGNATALAPPGSGSDPERPAPRSSARTAAETRRPSAETPARADGARPHETRVRSWVDEDDHDLDTPAIPRQPSAPRATRGDALPALAARPAAATLAAWQRRGAIAVAVAVVLAGLLIVVLDGQERRSPATAAAPQTPPRTPPPSSQRPRVTRRPAVAARRGRTAARAPRSVRRDAPARRRPAPPVQPRPRSRPVVRPVGSTSEAGPTRRPVAAPAPVARRVMRAPGSREFSWEFTP